MPSKMALYPVVAPRFLSIDYAWQTDRHLMKEPRMCNVIHVKPRMCNVIKDLTSKQLCCLSSVRYSVVELFAEMFN